MAKAKNKRTAKAKARTAATFHPNPNVRVKRVGDKTYDLSKYEVVKSAEGNSSLDNGDQVAKQLRGLELDDVYKRASKTLGIKETDLRSRYKHLNPGMQRMSLGNRLRAA